MTHPRIDFGGSEVAALSLVEALSGEHEVTFCTTDLPALHELNRFAGTSLTEDEFELELAGLPSPLEWTDRFAAVKGNLFEEYCQDLAPGFDLCISTYNVLRFGRPAIHFIADFSFDEHLRDQVTVPRSGVEKFWTRPSPVRSAYKRFTELFRPQVDRHWTSDCIIANSEWTRELLKERFGVEADVIYPPVPGVPEIPPLQEMEREFLLLGRVTQEKRTHHAIGILDDVRERGADVSLTIVGPRGEHGYARRISRMVEDREWVHWHGRVDESKKVTHLRRARFSLSTRPQEPFGIAVAETLRAGCIPFVPSGGGQVEIVSDPRLVYDSKGEAVEKILRVLESDSLQNELHAQLAEQRGVFSTENFQSRARALVKEALDANEATEPTT